MRFVLTIFVCSAISCTVCDPSTRYFFSNYYTFGNECDLQVGSITIPDSWNLTREEYRGQGIYDFHQFEIDSVIIKSLYDPNPAGNDLVEWISDFAVSYDEEVNSLSELHLKNGKAMMSMIEPSYYILAFEIAGGHCYFKFYFDELITRSRCEQLMIEYARNINLESVDFQEVNFEDNDEPLLVKLGNDMKIGIDDREIKGVLYIYQKSKQAIFVDENQTPFKNCDELSFYYSYLVYPFLDKLNSGTILTVTREYSSQKSIKSNDAIAQCIVRKNNTDEDIYTYFGGTLRVLYLNADVISKFSYPQD